MERGLKTVRLLLISGRNNSPYFIPNKPLNIILSGFIFIPYICILCEVVQILLMVTEEIKEKWSAAEVRVLSTITLIATFLMGALDAYTFLTKNEAFVSAQTGNIVELGIKFVRADYKGMSIHLVSFIGYFIGAFVGEFMIDKVVSRPKRRYAIFLGIQSILFLILISLYKALPNAVIIFVFGGVAGYGIALFKQMGVITINNGAMTGNTKNLAAALYRSIVYRDQGNLQKLRSLVLTILCFVCGVSVGAVLVNLIGNQLIWVFFGISLLQYIVVRLFWK